MAASLGLPFCSLPTMHCRTYGLFCEDTRAEILRRAERIAAFYSRDLWEFTGFSFACLTDVIDTEFVTFDVRGKWVIEPAFAQFSKSITEGEACLAGLDTIADFFGGEEINRRQLSQFMRLLGKLTKKENCAIIGTRHPSQSGRRSGTFESGSTGWSGKERARLVLRDPVYDDEDDQGGNQRQKFREPSNKRVLTRAKCNYAKPGLEIELIFENGGFKAAGVDPRAAPKRGQIRDLGADAKFLELLRKTRAQGRWVHDASNNPARYAPQVFAEDPDRGDFSKAEFKRAMTRAFGADRIKLVWTGGTKGHNEITENQDI